jgi:ABC-type multidrug transport system fused ATPase/permease subunit
MRTSLRAWPRALPYARPHKPLIGGSVGLLLVASVVQLAEPWPLALMVDSVLGDKALPPLLERMAGDSTTSRIALVASLGLIVTLLVHGVAVVNQYMNTKLDMRMVLDFRSRLFQHVQRLSFAFHDERLTGEFMGRINGQASSVGNVVVGVFPLVQAALTLMGMFYVAYRVNPTVALLSLSVVPFVYYSTGYYGTRIGPQIRKVKGMEMRSLHMVHEAMQMLRVIVAFNREDHEHRKFREQGEEAVGARVKVTVKQMLFALGVNLITSAGTALVLGVGAWQVLEGRLTVGRLLVLMSYIAAVYRPIETISATLTQIQESLIGFEMALELLETPPEIEEKPDAVAIERAAGRITFDHVSFAYAGRDHTLVDMSFDVLPGQAVAIVGPTGAGKTTMASLIPRFYDPAEGRVLLDDIDLRDLTLASLRAQISIVLQEPLLFTGSIADNIRYGRLDATQKEIEEAAKAANAHDFVTRLPQKYRTKLGERGAKLSGGERQRLCVARAFLKDAPILVLDEPTSSIDSRTEGVILEALERLMEGRTTLMIAHRLSTIRRASQILVIDDGRIVERGSHDELLAAHGLYRQLYELQNGHPETVPMAAPIRPTTRRRDPSEVSRVTGLRGRALQTVLNILERRPREDAGNGRAKEPVGERTP